MTKSVDAHEVQLKYMVHVLCVLRKLWKKREYCGFFSSKPQIYKAVWKPATASWLWEMALLCCPVFSSSTLPPASLNPPTEFHLPEACWGAAGVTALGLAKVRLFGGCSPTFIRDNCKALSNFRETGILYNIPENLNCCKIYPSTWQGRGVHAQREAEHIEEDDVREQKGPAVPQGTGSQVQWQQDRDPSWEGQAGQAQRLQPGSVKSPSTQGSPWRWGRSQVKMEVNTLVSMRPDDSSQRQTQLREHQTCPQRQDMSTAKQGSPPAGLGPDQQGPWAGKDSWAPDQNSSSKALGKTGEQAEIKGVSWADGQRGWRGPTWGHSGPLTPSRHWHSCSSLSHWELVQLHLVALLEPSLLYSCPLGCWPLSIFQFGCVGLPEVWVALWKEKPLHARTDWDHGR